jgi:hypothetical protein
MWIAVAIIALALWVIPSRLAFAAEKESKKSERKEVKAEREKGEKGERKEKGKKAEEEKAEQEGAQGEKVTLDQVPAAVRETLERVCRGAIVRDITKEIEGGKTLYDFEVTREGRAFEFDIAANGEVLSREEQVELSQLPSAVRQTIERAGKGGKVGTIMRVNEEGKTSYEAEIAIKGKTIEIAIAADGKVITNAAEKEEEKEKAGPKEDRGKVKGKEERGERKEARGERKEVKGGEKEDEDEENGKKAEKRDRKEMKGEKKEKGEREKAKEKEDDDEENGKKAEKRDRKEIKGEKKEKGEGKKEARKEKEDDEKDEGVVKFARLPRAVQKTLKREITGGELGEITKEIENGKVIYSAKIELDDEDYEVEIAANGKLIKKALDEEDEAQSEGKAEYKREGKKVGEREEKERKHGGFLSFFRWGGHEKKEHERD